ncbi:hypothetical protein NLX71_00885 [Paenibacillus sp. MZ04-78.2]|uniref:hypothetical protein n=1 Tax=Paenibacillus sp. MZ04-78.2 TaxID=2962034 RepID=UPI0020B7DEBA|nr:hypothetical protein [Paenibacillus sp. MZ04-78.2]MCP3771876.1 hypothetical protein [Paenibacillus sp. MZ04-78.2]
MLFSNRQKKLILDALLKERRRLFSKHKGELLDKTIEDLSQMLRNEEINAESLKITSSIGAGKAASAARPINPKASRHGVPFTCESTPRLMLVPLLKINCPPNPISSSGSLPNMSNTSSHIPFSSLPFRQVHFLYFTL